MMFAGRVVLVACPAPPKAVDGIGGGFMFLVSVQGGLFECPLQNIQQTAPRRQIFCGLF